MPRVYLLPRGTYPSSRRLSGSRMKKIPRRRARRATSGPRAYAYAEYFTSRKNSRNINHRAYPKSIPPRGCKYERVARVTVCLRVFLSARFFHPYERRKSYFAPGLHGDMEIMYIDLYEKLKTP